MVEDSPVERVTADRSRHPASLRHSPDFFLDALLLLYRHGLRVSRPRSGRLYFQVATHLAHPRRFDPCKLSAIASTRALRAQPARKSAAFKAGRRSSSFGSHGPVHALRWSETLLPEDTAPPSPCPTLRRGLRRLAPTTPSCSACTKSCKAGNQSGAPGCAGRGSRL